MQVTIAHFVFLFVGLLAGSLVAWLLLRSRIALAEANGRAAGELERTASTARIATLEEALQNEQRQAQEKLALLSEAREQLTNQFKALAEEILDAKSKKFTEQNQTNLTQLLTPLQQRIAEFKTKVEEVYVNEGKDRSALAKQVEMLTTLNNTLSQDTQNLTTALKGDSKAQGNWGELLLDRVLEMTGLVCGQHYDRQESVAGEDGTTRNIPDVVLHMPGDRHLVVDAKMTLPDYRAYASAENEDDRASALKKHLTSIRNHIKGLSEKEYQKLYGLKSLDFVVMFIPLEPAFGLAVVSDPDLVYEAWQKNVLLASPSTFLSVVRTVTNLWRREDLSRNAQDISKRGAELYDKLVGFVEDLQNVGASIAKAQENYDNALKKLSEGRGNLIRQAELLRTLGVKPSKSLPPKLVEIASEEVQPIASQETAAKNEFEETKYCECAKIAGTDKTHCQRHPDKCPSCLQKRPAIGGPDDCPNYKRLCEICGINARPTP